MSRLVIVGLSQILSDLVDCALARGDEVAAVLVDQAEALGERDLGIQQRLSQWAALGCTPALMPLADYRPTQGEQLVLGPTAPQRHRLVARLEHTWGDLPWATLVHPSAYVSPLACLQPGCFVGAGAIIAPGASLGRHVFINRGASVGHDTAVAEFARIQPRATLGGLIRVGRGATIGIAATVIERLQIGAESMVAAGAVVTADVPPHCLVAGVPAQFKKTLAPLIVD